MRGLLEVPIGRPPIPHEDARKLGTEQRRRLVEPAAGLNGIDGRTRRGGHPQPVQLGAHAPAGFIGRDHRAVPDGVEQRGVGRGGVAGRPMQRVDEATGRHGEAKVLLIESGDLAERQATLFMQVRRGRHGLGAELCRRRPERIGGL